MPSLRTTLALVAGTLLLSTAARADFQVAGPPPFAGGASAAHALWAGNPGTPPLTGFSHAVGIPNLPNDPASTLAATVTQWSPGAVVTTTGNIYGPASALSFEVRATLPDAARRVVLQFRTLGTPIDVSGVQLTLRDGLQALTAPATTPQRLLQVAGGFVVEEWLFDWDVTTLPIAATELVLTFDAAGANCSFDDARLDVQHDGALGANGCTANPNSTGAAARVSAHGDDRVAMNALRLRASSLPTATSGYFLVARSGGFMANPGGSQGNLCLSGAIGRYAGQVQSSGLTGRIEVGIDLTSIPIATGNVGAQVGETWHFQAWYRDANPTVTSNFTDATAVTLR